MSGAWCVIKENRMIFSFFDDTEFIRSLWDDTRRMSNFLSMPFCSIAFRRTIRVKLLELVFLKIRFGFSRFMNSNISRFFAMEKWFFRFGFI